MNLLKKMVGAALLVLAIVVLSPTNGICGWENYLYYSTYGIAKHTGGNGYDFNENFPGYKGVQIFAKKSDSNVIYGFHGSLLEKDSFGKKGFFIGPTIGYRLIDSEYVEVDVHANLMYMSKYTTPPESGGEKYEGIMVMPFLSVAIPIYTPDPHNSFIGIEKYYIGFDATYLPPVEGIGVWFVGVKFGVKLGL